MTQRNLDRSSLAALLLVLFANNHALEGFSPTVFEYTVALPAGTTEVPEVRPHDSRHNYETLPATHVNGRLCSSCGTSTTRRNPCAIRSGS